MFKITEKILASTCVMVVCSLSLTGLTSCKKSSVEDLKEAQMCLNTAPASQAKACLNKIFSDSSAQAYELRCAAEFIAENKNISTLLSALNNINSAPTTGNAIQDLKFSTTAIATDAFNYCTLSKISIYTQISSIFNISTIASTMAGGDILTQINNIPAATLGDIAVSTYEAACTGSETSSDSTKQYCAQISSAVTANAGDPTAIGNCLQYLLTMQGSAPPGCNVP